MSRRIMKRTAGALAVALGVAGGVSSARAVLVVDQQNGPGTGAIGLTAGVGMGQMTGHNGAADNLARVEITLSTSTATSLTLNVWNPVCDQCNLSIGSPALLGTQTIVPPNGGTAVFDFSASPIDLSGIPTIDAQHRLMLELVDPEGLTGAFLTTPAATYSGHLFNPANASTQLNNDLAFTTYGDIPPEVSFDSIIVTNAAAMRFASVSGAVYNLEFTTDIVPPTNWVPTGCTIAGDGLDKTFFDPTEPETNKTYRILVE